MGLERSIIMSLKIYNYFPNRSIRVVADPFAVKIKFGTMAEVKRDEIGDTMDAGKYVRFYVAEHGEAEPFEPLCTYRMHRPITELHVGQVTTRLSGGTSDDNFVTSSNAVQGRPFIRIHNATKRPLRLNNNIYVKPNSMTRYTGRHHFGVPLGLVLADQDKRYRKIQLTKPITDIYYGIVSEKPQPLYGGWQKVFSTADIDYSTFYDAYGHVLSL